MKYLSKLPVFVVSLFSYATVFAQIASDNAGNYTAPTFPNGSNEGSGFNAWFLQNSAGTAGHFIGDAGDQGTNSAGLNTGVQAFGIYAESGESADAYRTFSSPLSVGDTLSFQFAFSFDNGNKGFNLRNSTSGVFNFNINNAGYTWEDGGTAPMTSYAGIRDQGVLIDAEFTRTASGVDYLFSSAQDSNLDTSGSVALAGVDEIQFYINDAGAGSGGNLYFNNLQIIPEPDIALLFLSGLGFVYFLRRFR